jgi:hypothetical protein
LAEQATLNRLVRRSIRLGVTKKGWLSSHPF